jgi:hypothetical protein
VSDASLLFQPIPGGMSFDRHAQIDRQRFLFACRSRVRALECPGYSGGTAARDLLQQVFHVPGCLSIAAERSPLEEGAHSLTMRDASPLRVLEQLVEESQLGTGSGFRRCWGETLERNGHAITD